ncbi:MAG TPA: decaprenyl-phosphate phosphoribosyltransferase [bacterium]|nr:decaprenyl-phosphate phosphoribosyltransferase [bacterium]
MIPEGDLAHERTRGQADAPPSRAQTSLGAWVRLARPRQWVKNGLVFAALLFSGRLRDLGSVELAVLTFIAFCLASSAAYSVNDALDAREDRLHPKKRLRPVAAGTISQAQAFGFAAALAVGALVVGFAVNTWLGTVVLLYLGLNVLYSVRLKHAVLLDIMTIASGFVLRAAGGAIAIGVEMSLWFLVTVPLLSLFLAVGKRRHELVVIEGAVNHRRVLAEYSTKLLDQMLAALSASVIMAYLLYAKEAARPQLLMLTSPLVLYGTFRYLYLVYQRDGGGSPEELLISDVPLLATVALWALVTAAIIYLT